MIFFSRKNKHHTIPVIFVLMIGMVLFSCNYDKSGINPCNSVDSAAISFRNQIIPLLHSKCSIPGCHDGGSAGGHLDLTDSIAYSQLHKPGSGYIDSLNATNSIVYKRLNSNTQRMPPTGKLSVCDIRMVLKWIQEGAANN